jgi:hypothetical protein
VSPGDTGVSEPISESEMASNALSVVGRLNITYEAWRKPRYRATGDRMGRGNGSVTATITWSASRRAPTGTTAIELIGTSGSLTNETPVTITVAP